MVKILEIFGNLFFQNSENILAFYGSFFFFIMLGIYVGIFLFLNIFLTEFRFTPLSEKYTTEFKEIVNVYKNFVPRNSINSGNSGYSENSVFRDCGVSEYLRARGGSFSDLYREFSISFSPVEGGNGLVEFHSDFFSPAISDLATSCCGLVLGIFFSPNLFP
jgi:hypothetical protein